MGVKNFKCLLILIITTSHSWEKLQKCYFVLQRHPSECMFSKAGELISKKRSRLNPELAEDMLMLASKTFD